MRVILIMTLSVLFTNFTETLKNLKECYQALNGSYKLLNAFINTHEATTTKTKNHKNRIINNINQLYNKYFNTYKKNYVIEKVKDEEKIGRDYKQFEIIDNGDHEPKLTKKRKYRDKKP